MHLLMAFPHFGCVRSERHVGDDSRTIVYLQFASYSSDLI